MWQIEKCFLFNVNPGSINLNGGVTTKLVIVTGIHPPYRERTLQLSVSHLPLPGPPPEFPPAKKPKGTQAVASWLQDAWVLEVLEPRALEPRALEPWALEPWALEPWVQGVRPATWGSSGKSAPETALDLLNETIKCPFLSHYIPKMSWFYTILYHQLRGWLNPPDSDGVKPQLLMAKR